MMSRFFSNILIRPIRGYQKWLSPLKSHSTCRFMPSCSSYAIDAIERRGPVVGPLLALWRLLRCHPFSRGGYDPVVLQCGCARVEALGKPFENED